MKVQKIKNWLTLIIFFIASTNLFSEKSDTKNDFHFGFESEMMTFINNGYHGSFWAGQNGLRARLVVAKATFPSSLTPAGFKNLTSYFYECEIDYFFSKRKNEFRGIWFALGFGYTLQEIESIATNNKASVNLFDLHTGIGYVIQVYKGLYINPWIGLDLHLNAPKEVNVGSQIWRPRMFDPVLGIKLGYSF